MLDSWGIEIIIEGEAFLLCGNNRCGAPIDSNILVASIPSLLFRLLIAISSSSSSSLLSSLSCLYPFHRCLSYFSFIARNIFNSFFFAETKALSHGFGWHRLASCLLPWDFKDQFYFYGGLSNSKCDVPLIREAPIIYNRLARPKYLVNLKQKIWPGVLWSKISR